jgi:hypothetical protein
LNLHDGQWLLSSTGSPGDNDGNSSAVKISSLKHQYHDIPLLDAAEVVDVAQSKSKANTDDSEPGVHGGESVARQIGEGIDGVRGIKETIRTREDP